MHVWEKNEILKDCLGLVEEQKIRERIQKILD